MISAIRVRRLVFMTRAYGESGLETQPKGLKPLIQKWVFTQIFSGFQRFMRVSTEFKRSLKKLQGKFYEGKNEENGKQRSFMEKNGNK